MFATPAVAGGIAYVASCSGSVFAFDVATGAVRWRHETSREGLPANFHGNPVLTDDLLVLPGDKEPSASIYALERSSGALRWSERFDGGVSLDLLRSGDLLFAYTRRGDAVALDLATGRRVWSYVDGPRQVKRPSSAPVLADKRFVFAARPKDLFALDAASGRLGWHATLPGEPSTSIVILDGSLVLGTKEGRLHRVDPTTGSLTASLELAGRPSGTLVAADGCLFALIGPDSLACVDPALRRVRWRVTSPGGWSSPRPLVRDNEVVVGTIGGEVASFSFDGRELWRLRLDGEVRGLGSFNDTLLVGTREGMIYAVRPPSAR